MDEKKSIEKSKDMSEPKAQPSRSKSSDSHVDKSHPKEETKSLDRTFSKGSDEKIFTIPLRSSYRPRTKRTTHSVRFVRDYLKTHTKSDKIKIGKHLNEALWKRGLKRHVSSIRVRTVRDGDTVKAELFGHTYTDFLAKKKQATGGGLMERMKRRMTPKEIQKQEQEDLVEGKKKIKPEQPKPVEQKSAEK